MAVSRGKDFEKCFKEDFKRTFPNGLVYRIPDQVSMKKFVSQNIADFICYNNPYMYIVECKSIEKNTLNFNLIPQYERLLPYDEANIKGLNIFILVWFIEHKKVVLVPLSEITKMKNDGKKSINIKMLETKEYNLFEVPSISKRVNLQCDYTIFENIAKEVFNNG